MENLVTKKRGRPTQRFFLHKKIKKEISKTTSYEIIDRETNCVCCELTERDKALFQLRALNLAHKNPIVVKEVLH